MNRSNTENQKLMETIKTLEENKRHWLLDLKKKNERLIE